jgi:molecular chaperone GrpE
MDNTTENNENQEVETEGLAAEETRLAEDEAEIDSDSIDNVEVLKKEEKKEEDFKEKYYYLAAEMQNMQRRFDKEKENLLKYGSEKILSDMLDVVDNLERTVGFIKTDEDEKVKNIVVGIQMIEKMFIDSLGKHGLKEIEALGKEFDPHIHEALAQQPAEGKENMEIIQVHQKGYTLNERVVRAAKVVVVKND